MILDEDPADLLRHTIGNFNIAPDKLALSRVRESLSSLAEMRSLRILEVEDALKKLSRTHSTLGSQNADLLSAHSSAAHASHILALDTQKFRIAKAASDLEVEGERLSAELSALRSRLQRLEAEGVEGDEAARERRELDDPTVLKLKIFRGLGVDVEPDEAGLYRKAVVRGRSKGGDVSVVAVEPRMSRMFYANYFWDAI